MTIKIGKTSNKKWDMEIGPCLRYSENELETYIFFLT